MTADSRDEARHELEKDRDRDHILNKPWYLSVDGRSRFLPDVLRNHMIEKYDIRIVNGRPMAFRGGECIYSETALKELIRYEDCNLTVQKVNEVFVQIVGFLVLGRYTREEAPPNYIRFRNGILDIDTGELLPASGDLVILNTIPHDYDPSAECPELDALISRIMCGDPALMDLLGEIVGYSMYRSLRFRKAFLFVGGNRNGKSTFMNLLMHMLGADNVSSIALHDLQHEFKRVCLYGMLANIGDDIADKYIADVDVIKKLISGERVDAANKFKDTFFFKSVATPIFSCNDVPSLNDASGALMDRFVPIPFRAYFSEASSDLGLEERLKTDAMSSRLINIGLQGLARILRNNRFSEPEAVAVLKSDISSGNSHLSDFLSENDVLWSTTSDAYDRYLGYCQNNMISASTRLSLKGFTRKVNSALNAWSHKYSADNSMRVFEPLSTQSATVREIRVARAGGWTGRIRGDPAEPARVPMPVSRESVAVHSPSAVLWSEYVRRVGMADMAHIDAAALDAARGATPAEQFIDDLKAAGLIADVGTVGGCDLVNIRGD